MIREKHIWELLGQPAPRERKFFEEPWHFMVFSVLMIMLSLGLYVNGYEEVMFSMLVVLWVIFWRNSDRLGRIFLVMASVVGFTHEIVGVWLGLFEYTFVDYFSVPIFLLPGYGIIYWAAENFWAHLKEKTLQQINFRLLAFGTILMLFMFDVFYSGFSLEYGMNLLFLMAIMLAFNELDLRDRFLVYITGFITGFDEIAGIALGAWTHKSVHLLSIVPPYLFLVWLALLLSGKLREYRLGRQIAIMGAAFGIKVAYWLMHLP
ncbi:MAG: hypothetical protein ABH829_01050 [archaeon]